MYVRKRGQFYHCEFFVNGKRYAISSNGKDGKPVAADKKEPPASRQYMKALVSRVGCLPLSGGPNPRRRRYAFTHSGTLY